MPILFVTVLIDLIGFGIVIPILPFMAPSLGASHFEIALVIAIYSVFNGLAGPAWGKLSDRIGRKPVLLICLAGGALSYLLLAFASSLMMLYLARALGGAMAGNFAVASAMVADMSEPKDRAKYMGIMGSAFGLGMVIGPFIGGVLAGDEGNYRLVGLFAAGLSASAIVAGLFFLKESLTPGLRAEHASDRATHGDGGSILQMLKNSGNRLLAVQFFLATNGHTIVSFLFPLWVGSYLGWGAKEVGMVFGVQGLAMAVMQASLIGKMVAAIGELRVLLMGAVSMAGGFLVAALANTQSTILFAFFLAVSGGTICNPVLNSLVANRTAPHLRGRMLGTTASSAAFGRVAGPLFAGLLLSISNFHVAWLSGVVIAVLMAAWAVSQMRLTQVAGESA